MYFFTNIRHALLVGVFNGSIGNGFTAFIAIRIIRLGKYPIAYRIYNAQAAVEEILRAAVTHPVGIGTYAVVAFFQGIGQGKITAGEAAHYRQPDAADNAVLLIDQIDIQYITNAG